MAMRWGLGLVAGISFIFLGVSFAQEQPAATLTEPDGPALLEELRKKEKTLGPYYVESTSTEFRSTDAGLPERGTILDTTKIWRSGEYSRIERSGPGETTSVTIHRPDAVYQYTSRDGQWVKRAKPMTMKVPKGATVGTMGPEKVVGSEILNGKRAIITELIVPPIMGTASTIRIWYWEETDLPLKSETVMHMGDQVSKMIEEYTYVFQDISEEMFKIPEEKVVEQPR